MNKSICSVKGCRNYEKYCRLHLQGALTEPAPIAKQSDDMKEAMKEYARKCSRFKKENPVCKAKIEGICQSRTNDVHHQKGRATKDDLLNEKYWLPVCRKCHDFLEQNPAWAKQNGLSLSRHLKKVA